MLWFNFILGRIFLVLNSLLYFIVSKTLIDESGKSYLLLE